jgi:predicted ATP-dependent endonuclease of OLD family
MIENFSAIEKFLLENISNAILEIDKSIDTHKNYNDFFAQINIIKSKLPLGEKYLFTFAYKPNNNDKSDIFFTFNRSIFDKLITNIKLNTEIFSDLNLNINSTDDDIKKSVSKKIIELKDKVLNLYNYIYIPAEIPIDEFLRIESHGMHSLMGYGVREELEQLLKSKFKLIDGTGKTKTQSILEIINNNLELFLDKVQKTIKNIEEGYDFDKEYKAKANITTNHLADIIINNYFSKRKLKKENKLLTNLSSGERKKSLIDISYAFLKNSKDNLQENQKQIILAIDEPETSLHTAACYDQFERLEDLASNFNIQLLVTTHWYGCLPIVLKGNVVHITKTFKNNNINISVTNYNLYKIRVDITNTNHLIKETLDYSLKSYNDLAQSILFSLLNEVSAYNWILCEGNTDKIYLEHMLNSFIIDKKIRIIPLGGASKVNKFYNLLLPHFEDKEIKNKFFGKVICLIDTDAEKLTINEKISNEHKNIQYFRLLQNQDEDKLNLVNVNDNTHSPVTTIEDSLDSNTFFITLKDLINENNYPELNEVISNIKVNENQKLPHLYFNLRPNEKKMLDDFFDGNNGENKVKFALKYVENSKNNQINYKENSLIVNLKQKFNF